jgi:hypothetical protein
MMNAAFGALVPNPGAALWIGLLVTFVVLGDARDWRAPTNSALLGLLALAVPLSRALKFGEAGSWTAGPLFAVIFIGVAAYAAWAFALSRRSATTAWRVNLSRNGLRVLLLAVLALDTIVVLGRAPDDAGIYSNLGAQRWVETGVLPYGDAMLKGPDAPAYGAAATYGPVLYAAHIPFQLVFRVPSNPPDAVVKGNRAYRWPSVLATKLACFGFFLGGLWALVAVVRRYAGEDLALAAAIVFAGSPYVIGLGGDEFVVGGLAYISHIAPSAVLLLAFATLGTPVLSGALLAAAAGVLFWPAFLFPLWFGWRAWRRDGVLPFTAGFAVTGVAILALVVWFTHAGPGESALRLMLQSTLEHQEGFGAREYGASAFSFWGTHPGLAAFWQHPLYGSTSVFKPTFLLFVGLCLAAAVWARARTVPQFAALTAMLGSAIQLWKTHATGTYVEWWLPFLLIALFCAGSDGETATTHAPDQNGR